jgi:hypothetical protein
LGTLLAAYVWVVWLEQNRQVFNSSSQPCAANFFFCILYLFKFRPGSSLSIEHIGQVTMAPAVGPSAPARPATPTGNQQSGMVHSSRSVVEDEDLLNYWCCWGAFVLETHRHFVANWICMFFIFSVVLWGFAF